MASPVVVVDYDPSWPSDYALIRDHLKTALPPGVWTKHVGSTAVPGLAAKPVIDVDVVVDDDHRVQEVVEAIETLGYERRGDLGIAGREAFTVLPGLPYHHLYVVVDGSPAYHDHVDLRDHLRSHPYAAERYAAEKRRLAHLLLTDRDAYVQGKAWLVAELLAAARAGCGARPPRRPGPSGAEGRSEHLGSAVVDHHEADGVGPQDAGVEIAVHQLGASPHELPRGTFFAIDRHDRHGVRRPGLEAARVELDLGAPGMGDQVRVSRHRRRCGDGHRHRLEKRAVLLQPVHD